MHIGYLIFRKINAYQISIYFSNEDKIVNFSNSSFEEIIKFIMGCRLKQILIYNGDYFFAFLDSWVYNKHIGIYSDNSYARIYNDCYSLRNGEGVSYQRKLWLKTKKNNSTDRHYRLSSTEFINFGNMFGGMAFKDALKAYDISPTDDIKDLAQLVDRFDKELYNLLGFNYIKGEKVIGWTMGSIAKRYYLSLKYPMSNKPLMQYLQNYPAYQKLEYRLRLARLLVGGLLYVKDNKEYSNVYKYDINSLFGYVEKNIPALVGIQSAIENEFFNPKEEFEYIIVAKDIMLECKKEYIPLDINPFELYSCNKKFITITGPVAFFRPYWEIITKYYNIIDITPICYYKCIKEEDPAIQIYVDKLYSKKTEQKRNNNFNHSLVVKFLLVNLHGKFSQSTINSNQILENKEGIIHSKTISIKDNWTYSHFDYIRGAYIYTMAKVYMMKLIAEIIEQRPSFKDELLYSDTDSLISTVPLEQYIKVDPYILGAFKLEYKYKKFKAYAPKVYAGISEENEYKLTAAGINKEEVLIYLKNNYNLTTENYLKLLDEVPFYPITILSRTPDGAEFKVIQRPLISKDTNGLEIPQPYMVSKE